jgi:hypothetical protein
MNNTLASRLRRSLMNIRNYKHLTPIGVKNDSGRAK